MTDRTVAPRDGCPICRALSCGCDLHDAERVEWMRDCLEEIARNAENLAAGGLPHFTRRDFALAVADRARAALKGRYR